MPSYDLKHENSLPDTMRMKTTACFKDLLLTQNMLMTVPPTDNTSPTSPTHCSALIMDSQLSPGTSRFKNDQKYIILTFSSHRRLSLQLRRIKLLRTTYTVARCKLERVRLACKRTRKNVVTQPGPRLKKLSYLKTVKYP